MSNSIVLNLNNHNYTINTSDIKRLINAESKSDAVSIGLWESFKDLFRTEKKAQVIANIYDLLHSDDVEPAEKDSTSVENEKVNLGPISIFNKIIQYANEAHQDLFSIKYNNDEDTISFHIANTILKTVHIADVFETIKIDNESFVDNYGTVLRVHHTQNDSSTIVTESKNKVKVEGADDLKRYSSPFYSDNPDLVDFLNNSKIYDYDTYCRVSDKMIAPRRGVAPDFLAQRDYYLATINDHLLKFNGEHENLWGSYRMGSQQGLK